MKKLLGERLLESGLVRGWQLAQALQAQQSTGEQLGKLLVRLGYLREDDLLRLLCEDADIPFSTLEGVEPNGEALSAVPESVARAAGALPLSLSDGTLNVALTEPFDVGAITSLEQATGLRAAVVAAPRSQVLEAIDRFYRAPPDEAGRQPERRSAPDRFAEASDSDLSGVGVEASGTTARIVDEIFQKGVALGATDIHIEPTEDAVRVRYRLDGILRDGPVYLKPVQAALITRIKVLAGLNIAESRLPQDGRLRLKVKDRDIDLRISTFPTLHGEDVVLRVLDRTRIPLELSGLGMPREDLELFREVLHRPLGLILMTGPTGSGKTTTLYAALNLINTGERCIITLEDPIEYELAGVRQSQINVRAGLTFASGLRSMLRHDPDVILVGEIRDHETAQICLSAAMTGHLVLSTLHTDSAASAVSRLMDIGAEPYAVAASFQLAIAQRLVRQLCAACRAPAEVPSVARRRFELGDRVIYRAVGCPACGGTGYKGRVPIFEFLPVNDGVTQAIHERRPADEIRRRANRPHLFEAGLAKVRAGQTSLEELLRVITPE